MYQEEYVDTAIQQTWRVAPPVSAGELTVWLKHGIVAQRSEPAEWLQNVPAIREQDVAYLIANTLETPLVRESVKMGVQVGRFVMVEYKPQYRPDPTVVMTVISGARRYHMAALQFSQAASQVTSASWWYDDMRNIGRQVASELAQLQSCAEEAGLVMSWLLDRITYGEPRHERLSW